MKLVLLCLLLAGCASSDLSDIDIGHADKACARECTTAYSGCISGGPSVGFKTETINACKASLRLCVKTCDKS